MAHSIATAIGERPILTRSFFAVAALVTIHLINLPMLGAHVGVSARPVAPYDAVQVALCSRFVDGARAQFGPEWKRRLDPANTSCAEEIQKVWERDWEPRKAQPDVASPSTMSASGAQPPQLTPTQALPAPAPQSSVLAAAAIMTGSTEPLAPAETPEQIIASDFDDSIAKDGNPRDAATSDPDDVGMDPSANVQDKREFPPKDYGVNDDQNGATRALNNEQIISHRRMRRADKQRLSNEDRDVEERDDSRDEPSWSQSP